MKQLSILVSALLLAAAAAGADEQTRNVQTQLKEQGFYYGEVDGKGSPELSAAIRRYQIRNGLEVSGDLNKETAGALRGISPASTEPKQPVAEARSVAPQLAPPAAGADLKPRPPANLRRTEDIQESDRRALEEETGRPSAYRGGTLPPPAPLDGGAVETPRNGPFSDFFAGTPYANAPRVVQDSTMRRAQQVLADRGFYRDAIDGTPGPATEEAVLSYQRYSRIPLTGRLDLQTLATLRLLPGRGVGNPPLKPFNTPVGDGQRPVYRGVWVN